jgi:chromosomal replication initiator protein
MLDEQLQFSEIDALAASRKAWERALDILAPEINKPSFEYIKTARPIAVEGDSITIGASGELARIFLEKYSEPVKVALESVLGREVQISFVVAPKEEEKPRPTNRPKEHQPATGIIVPGSLPLNDKYVFSNFVVGPSNRMAHAVAKAVAERPGSLYNPFFLYGGPGLGKTHLLQAIGHYIIANHPGMRVAYVSGEAFTSQYVASLREHKSEDFRQRFRNVNVLLVDDIQFLASRERTKEEFFHTFNVLYQADRQIVLTSDRPPRELNPIEERLKSRFEAGVVVDISAPDLETRIAILQKKALDHGVDVPMPVLECIAEMVPSNIRGLEGALITLLAHTSLMKAPLTVSVAREVLAKYIAEKKLSEITPEAVQRAVAKAFDLPVEEIRNDCRRKELVTARHIAMYLCRELTPFSGVAIGKAFGGKDHATVIHACKKVEKRMNEDPSFRNIVQHLAEGIKAGRI